MPGGMQMSLIKAMILGAILTLVVSGAIGAAGYTGGILSIEQIAFQGHYFRWSWGLFIISTGLSWGIMLIMK